MHQVFLCLRKHHDAEMVFDPSDTVIDHASFERKDWASGEFGHVLGEEKIVPPNMPHPRGLGFVTAGKVDTDHAADTVT